MRKSDQRVLDAIRALNTNAYGVTIKDYLDRTRRWKWWPGPSFGSIYVSLERLEEAGLIRSEFDDRRPERGYRRRLYFFPTTLTSAQRSSAT